MPPIPKIRKAMIVIAVSKYKEPYANLPGTLTSAARMVAWARGPAPGRGYDVLEISDADGQEVTVDRLRKEITGFLGSRLIDRLVVYFAGHGLVRSAADQFWLLTNAATDLREGVELMGFIEGLKRYGIGATNPELNKGQLSIMADACRNTARDALHFNGDPILTRNEASASLEVDMLMATTLGDYAYQPQAVAGGQPFCLFSDVLSDALEGKVPQVIDANHPFGTVIDNQLLASYLDREVPDRAKVYSEVMQPDTNTGMRRNCNFYDVLSAPTAASPAVVAHGGTDAGVATEMMPWPTPDSLPPSSTRIVPPVATMGFQPAAQPSSGYGHVLDRGETLMQELDVSEPPRGAVVSEFDHQIALPKTMPISKITTQGQKWVYRPDEIRHEGQPFVRQREHWTLAPLYPRSVTALLPGNPGDVLVHGIDDMGHSSWETTLSTSVANTRRKHRTMKEAILEADKFRYNKEAQPLNADLAAYIYLMSGDQDNIVRTAHYMVENEFLSCDLAFLAASDVRWVRDDQGWQLFADLPGVEADIDPHRPEFASNAMAPRPNVQVNTLFPAFRQGWQRMADLRFETMPPVLRQLAHMAMGYSGVVLPDAAMLLLIEEFDYVIHDQGPTER